MEGETPRNRTLTNEEYSALLENSSDWLRHVIAMAWETAPSRSDLLRSTWSEIDIDEGIIELKDGRGKTGKPQAMPIFTPELQALLSELQSERRRLPNVDELVLTIDGQPIDELKFEYHFRKARKAAGTGAGVPTAAAMLAAGHSSVASHKHYQNPSKAD